MLNFTPKNKLTDSENRPYFLWDMDITLEKFQVLLRHPDRKIRAYMIAKLLRQAKPDDVFQFIELKDITENWSAIDKHLGKSREFWKWLLEQWGQKIER